MNVQQLLEEASTHLCVKCGNSLSKIVGPEVTGRITPDPRTGAPVDKRMFKWEARCPKVNWWTDHFDDHHTVFTAWSTPDGEVTESCYAERYLEWGP